MHRLIVSVSLAAIVFLFWLALSAKDSTIALFPGVVAVVWSAVTAALIRRPFELRLGDSGLDIITPFGDAHFDWGDLDSFAVKRADPWTTFIAYKLKPGVKTSWLWRLSAPGGFDGGLYPYFELANSELIGRLKTHRYRSIASQADNC